MARRDGADGTGDWRGEREERNKYEEGNGKRRRGINIRKGMEKEGEE